MWFFKKNKDGDKAAKSETTVEAQPEGAAPAPEQESANWFKRIRSGLSKSSSKISGGITAIFTQRKLDYQTLEELEELLISADLGLASSAKLVSAISKNRFGKEVTPDEVRNALAEEIARIIQPAQKPLELGAHKPFVMLMAGVNGTGKTTTIGKLAQQYRREGKSVMLAAGDTFRAAAVNQLKTWAERTGADFFAKGEGADAAALAYEAIELAQEKGVDILMIDTAGRLQNKANLMEELAKVVRVIQKKLPEAPHAALLVLDATVGQNAVSQVEMFKQTVPITGLVLTKLDGTAKGGVLVSLVEKFALPVHAIGIGEGVDDLRPFDAQDFAASLMGIDSNGDINIAHRTQTANAD